MPNNPPPKADGYINGDKRKGRVGDPNARGAIIEHAKPAGLVAGVLKLFGVK